MKVNSFRTEITCPTAHPIGLKDTLLTSGSCFADQFGNWLQKNKFKVQVNPFGPNYNPISIHKSLTDSITMGLDRNLFVEHQNIWHHYDYHSQWSSLKKEELEKSIHAQLVKVQQHLLKTDVLLITYGTAWVYQHKSLNSVVSNCHKIPANQFDKKLLSVEEITTSFSHLYSTLKQVRPKLRILLTVSPVRHVKDTLSLNSASKATLRLACHQLINQFKEVDYFPSYEIMMDDLRDYRFYERDKIHPTEEALDYINQKFSDQCFSMEVKNFVDQWTIIRQALNHKPYHPTSHAHQQFLKELLLKLKAISEVSVAEEIDLVQSQINQHA